MRRLKTWWSIVLTLLSVPYLVLFTVGSIWLYQYHMLWQWLVISGVCTLAGWFLMRWLRSKNLLEVVAVQPSGDWPASGRRAWEQVEAIALRVQQQDAPITRPEQIWDLFREVLQTVAQQYHPRSSQAMLEIPVPHALRIVELVAGDLRETFSRRVPGAHILTINDLRRLSQLAVHSQHLYLIYKIIAFGLNPVTGVLRELRDAAGEGLAGVSGEEIKRWALGFCARKAGYYAIQLYSGHLVLDEVEFDAYQTRQSQRDILRSQTQAERLAQEPLRILVLGQVKSGKSSLINALFGETRAAVDVVPRTRNIDPYVLEREGIPHAIILDTAGYEQGDNPGDAFLALRDEILRCDLVLMASSALSAARGADRRLLDALRHFYQSQPDRLMPPVVVALTHVDQMRPLNEWNPPYNLADPTNSKACNIADATAAVTEDLGLAGGELVIPVCLKPGQIYNVEEGLAPAILQSASEAQRVKYLRCLREYHREEYWQRLWQQAVNSGRILLKFGTVWAGRTLGKRLGGSD
jgi:predicted GTPase